MVSLKFETENPNDCISLVTGQDLCLSVQIMEFLIAVFILIIIGLLVYKNRLLKIN